MLPHPIVQAVEPPPTVGARRPAVDVLAAAMHDAPHGVVIADAFTGRWLAVNTAMGHLVRYPSSRLIELGLGPLTHPDDQHLGPEALASLVAGLDRVGPVQQRCVRSDGAVVSVRITGSRLRDESGRPTAVVLHVEDLATEAMAGAVLSQASERLASAERRHDALLTHAGEMVLVVGLDGRAMSASGGWPAMLGWDPRTLPRISLEDRVHPGDIDAVLAACAQVRSDPDTIEHVGFRVRHASGRWRHLRMTVSNRVEDPDVGGMVFNIVDVSELAAARQQLESQEVHDVLTGLPNRRLATDRLTRALARRARSGGHVAVVAFDVVRLDSVNETLGHAAGDAVLCEVSRRLHGAARPADTVARLEGDSFVLIADGIEEERSVVALVMRMRDAVNQPFCVDGTWLVPDVNVGMATTAGDATADADGLLRRAVAVVRGAKTRN